MRTFGTNAQLEKRRLETVNLFDSGWTTCEVAKKFHITVRSAQDWKKRFIEEGIDALKAKPVPGAPSYFNEKQKQKLQEVLLSGARKYGFDTDLWTCPRVQGMIEKKFGVHYHVDYLPRLLRKLGWSVQMPQKKASRGFPALGKK